MTLSFVTRAMVLTAVTVAGWLYIAEHAGTWGEGEVMEGCEVAEVIDTRTVRLTCGEADRLVRLEGLGVPDVGEPGCDAELAHGALGRDRLRVLLEDGPLEWRRTGEPMEGVPGTPVSVRVTVEDENVADRLVREGLAVEAGGEGAAVNWCDRLGAPVDVEKD
ncbi:MAG: hypothetical protein RLO10_13075 [Roseovarius indicus]